MYVRLKCNCKNCEHMYRQVNNVIAHDPPNVHFDSLVPLWWRVLDVDGSCIEVRLKKFLLDHEIDDNFLTKFKFRRLMVLLLVSSVSGKLEVCICGWSCPFPWDPGGGCSDKEVAHSYSQQKQPRNR